MERNFCDEPEQTLKQTAKLLNMWSQCNEWLNKWKRPHNILGAVSIRKTVLPGMAIPMLKIRRPNGRLIFNMEIAIRR